MVKKTIGYIVSWTLFWLGHLIGQPMYHFDYFAWLYPAYNNLMHWSICVQDWAGLDEPWEKPRG